MTEALDHGASPFSGQVCSAPDDLVMPGLPRQGGTNQGHPLPDASLVAGTVAGEASRWAGTDHARLRSPGTVVLVEAVLRPQLLELACRTQQHVNLGVHFPGFFALCTSLFSASVQPLDVIGST